MKNTALLDFEINDAVFFLKIRNLQIKRGDTYSDTMILTSTSDPTNDSLDIFLDQHCAFFPNYSIGKGKLYADFLIFCAAHSLPFISMSDVGKKMKTLSFVEESRTKHQRIWKGVKVSDIKTVEPQTAAEPIQELVALSSETMTVLPPVEKANSLFFRDESAAVNSLLIRAMMGEAVEIRRL